MDAVVRHSACLQRPLGRGYSASYTYDANGNRTSKTLNGSTDTYTVDDGDKLTSITSGGVTVKSYTYDAAGRTKTVTSSVGTTTLSYDYEDRVSSITYPSSATNSFTYNGLDTRVGKLDSSGTSTYKRDGADVTDPVLSDGSALYTPGVSERRGSTTTFDHQDYLGTMTRQTDSAQTTTATRTYDAFGLLVSSTGTPQGPFGFVGAQGYQEDADSGLKLLGHRYYDPSTGRFLTRDPVKDGRNWYDYCGNRPNGAIDSDGHFWFIVVLIIVVVAAAGCNKDSANGAAGTAIGAPLPSGAGEAAGALGAPGGTLQIRAREQEFRKEEGDLERDPGRNGTPSDTFDTDQSKWQNKKIFDKDPSPPFFK